MTFTRAAVVGAGLIGGSVALRLHAQGHDVVVVDPDPTTLAGAVAAGLRTAEVVPADCDLVVLAMVNAGAEVIADGHIHVYAPLRGKAMAGARGNADARIFALSLEPELLSIAGIYRTSDVPLPKNIWGHPTQVRLVAGPDGDKLEMHPIKT